MKYLKQFDTEAAYTAASKEKTQVSYIKDPESVKYDKEREVPPVRKITVRFLNHILPELIELTNAEFNQDKTEILFTKSGPAEIKINNVGGYDNVMGFDLTNYYENRDFITSRFLPTETSTINIMETSNLISDMILNISCVYVDPANPDVNLSLKITGGAYMNNVDIGLLQAAYRMYRRSSIEAINFTSEELLTGVNFTIKSGWPIDLHAFADTESPADTRLHNVRFTPTLPDGWTFADFRTKGVPPMDFAMEADFDYIEEEYPEDF